MASLFPSQSASRTIGAILPVTLSGVVNGALDATLGDGDTATNAGNAPTLLMLDDFKFSLNTIVFETLQRSRSYNWAAQKRFGQVDALQFVGPGDDTVTLPGIVYPDYIGDQSGLEKLAQKAASGQPCLLLALNGVSGGYWVITEITSTRSYFKPDGSVRKIEFQVSLKYFGATLPSQSANATPGSTATPTPTPTPAATTGTS